MLRLVSWVLATSLFLLAFMSAGATIIHLATGTLGADEAPKIAALALGAVPGAQLGTHLAQRIKGRSVLLLLGSAIVVLGARLLLKAIADV